MKKVLLLAACACVLRAQTATDATKGAAERGVQFLWNGGAPAAGAQLCTFSAGSSTPAATYTDSTGSKRSSNPITLDGDGRAHVWLGGSAYRLVLYTGGNGACPNAGAAVWSQDSVNEASLEAVNYVKAPSGSRKLIEAFTAGLAASDLAVAASLQLTRDTGGIADNGAAVVQGSKPSFGGALEYRKPLRYVALEASYAAVSTDARFYSKASGQRVDEFSLVRHEVSGQIVKQLYATRQFSPFFAAGIGNLFTSGPLTGIDCRLEEVVSVGMDARLTRDGRLSFRSEAVVHFFEAPDFADPGYRATRTVIIEPRVGLVWRFGGAR